jgi:hypothetical protein
MRKHRQRADPFRRARKPVIPETGNAKREGQDIVKLEEIIKNGQAAGLAQTCCPGECTLITFSPKRFDTQKKL